MLKGFEVGASELIAIASIAFAIFQWTKASKRMSNSDIKEQAKREGEQQTMVMLKLENISNDLRDIKKDSKDMVKRYQEIMVEVAELSQSVKSLHKRVDKLEGKEIRT